MTTTDAFARLNPAQREAATFGEALPGRGVRARPLLVIAGAGTGKTSTLAHRVAHLLLEGVAPERLLLLTFSRRAAVEMTRRAQQVVAEALQSARGSSPQASHLRLPWSGTFHATGNRLIREYARRLGLDPER
jgi:DNA helicase-2/ATP-dependent DNA helicase PcrA